MTKLCISCPIIINMTFVYNIVFFMNSLSGMIKAKESRSYVHAFKKCDYSESYT